MERGNGFTNTNFEIFPRYEAEKNTTVGGSKSFWKLLGANVLFMNASKES